MNAVVERIDELRKKKGFTKKALMTAMDVAPSTFNSWYYSDITPSLNNIENVCNALNITIEQFFSGMSSENGKSSEEKFLDSWRMLTDKEKLAVNNVIAAFKEDKAVDND